jgi:hypothetical protein
MRDTHLTSLAGLDDQCLTHHFIRVHGRAPSTEELADLRGRQPAPPLEAHLAQVDPSSPTTPGTPRRLGRQGIAKLIHRL